MSNLISREAIQENIEKIRQGALMMDDTRRASIIMNGMHLCEEAVINQPTVATTLTKEDTAKPYINQVKIGDNISIMRDAVAHDQIAELRDMIERLKGKPYYMKIQCHNCGAPLVIESSNHLIKCKYCQTAYFSGTQLVNSGI